MPTFTINDSFNIGQDVSLSLQHLESGVVIPITAFGHLMEFDATQEDRDLIIIPITDGGKPKLNVVYQGWSGHMIFTRVNGIFTGLFAALEANFYNARQLSHFAIQATVLNRDGSTDQYLWSNTILHRATGGNWRADKEVDQRVEFRADSMVVTGGAGAIIPLL
jgi:hypothetical protein